jgi:signal transduction histidine kinase
MKRSVDQGHSERASTDGSLRAERDKTDRELAQKRAAIEQRAADVVDTARDKADDVVRGARDLADSIAPARSDAEERAVESERAVADGALRAERSKADHAVKDERDERRRALASLLRLEREETDDHLLTERGSADDAVGARDLLLAMVSHDLRSLLGGIALTAQILQREFAEGDGPAASVRSRADKIQRLTARMNRLIGDLVDIASIESGKLVVEPAPEDLRELLTEVVETFRLSAAAHQLTIEWDDPERPVMARIDHDRIVQVVANLLTNAIKFTAKGGTISLRLDVEGDSARVSVGDTGIGIPADRLEAIFDRFSQVGTTDRRGLGLGLYISRCLVESHGGRIWADSAAGAGSTFFFTAPRA